jgi:hypothetical protein
VRPSLGLFAETGDFRRGIVALKAHEHSSNKHVLGLLAATPRLINPVIQQCLQRIPERNLG